MSMKLHNSRDNYPLISGLFTGLSIAIFVGAAVPLLGHIWIAYTTWLNRVFQ